MSVKVTVDGKTYPVVSTISVGGKTLAVESEVSAPSGIKNITTNGTHDVSAYAQAVVNVPTDGASGGAPGEWEEVYSKAITEAANLIAVPYDSAWDQYAVLAMVFDGVTLSASDFIRVGCDNTALSGNGFYPAASVKVTEVNAECALLIRANSARYMVKADNSNQLTVLESLSTINVFATTSATNITGGTIKIKGLR